MWRFSSQLCEVFDCTERELRDRRIVDAAKAWLEATGQKTCLDLWAGELVNGDLAAEFHRYWTAEHGGK